MTDVEFLKNKISEKEKVEKPENVGIEDVNMNSTEQDITDTDDSLEEKIDTDDEAGDIDISDVTDILKRYEHLVDSRITSEAALASDTTIEDNVEEEPEAKIPEKDSGSKLLTPGESRRKSRTKGVKSFNCPDCGKGFTQKANMNTHYKSIHEGVKYPCDHCDYKASSKGNLGTHVKKMHEGMKSVSPKVKKPAEVPLDEEVPKGSKEMNLEDDKEEEVLHKSGYNTSVDLKVESDIENKSKNQKQKNDEDTVENYSGKAKQVENSNHCKDNRKRHIRSVHKVPEGNEPRSRKMKNQTEVNLKVEAESKQMEIEENKEETGMQKKSAEGDNEGKQNEDDSEGGENVTGPLKHIDKKATCNYCGKQFSGKGNLKKHIRSVHEKLRYPCDQCEYQAVEKRLIKFHIQSKHEGVTYPCPHCDHRSKTRSTLYYHNKKMHSV